MLARRRVEREEVLAAVELRRARARRLVARCARATDAGALHEGGERVERAVHRERFVEREAVDRTAVARLDQARAAARRSARRAASIAVAIVARTSAGRSATISAGPMRPSSASTSS